MKKIKILKPENLGHRNWGEEYLLSLVSGKYSFKKLIIKAGKKGGLQYHQKKNECGYLVSGKLILKFDDGNGNLISKEIKPGQAFHIPPGAVHQEYAITDCEIIEVSTPHFNDRVRVEKKYGLRGENGLPSTTINEIIEK